MKLEHEESGLSCLKAVQNVCVVSVSQQFSAATSSSAPLKFISESVFLKESLLIQHLDSLVQFDHVGNRSIS